MPLRRLSGKAVHPWSISVAGRLRYLLHKHMYRKKQNHRFF